MSWKINTDEPTKLEKYDWHTANQDDQGMEETRSPGDFKYRTQNVDLVPSEIQVPSDQLWKIDDDPSETGWYVYGAIEDA